MAHYQKFKRGSVGIMLGHYDRTKPSDKLIHDPALTKNNYNLCSGDGTQLDRLRAVVGNKEQKIKGWAKCQNRIDVNVMCTWVVSLPKDLAPELEKNFFEQTYEYLKNKYGVEGGKNIVSAWVHKDEETPHLHFCFVPVVKDKKKDRWKVSAKECVTIVDLKGFHADLQKHLEAELGCRVGIQNGATINGNKAVAELRQMTAEGKVQAIKEQAKANEEKSKELAERDRAIDDQIVEKKERLEILEEEIAEKKEKLERLENSIKGRVLVASPVGHGHALKNKKVEEGLAYLRGLEENTILGFRQGTFTISDGARSYLVKLIEDLEVTTRELRYCKDDLELERKYSNKLRTENQSLSKNEKRLGVMLRRYMEVENVLGPKKWREVLVAVNAIKQRRQERRLKELEENVNTTVNSRKEYRGR